MVVGTWNTTKSRENAPTSSDKFGCPCGRSPTGKCIGWHRLSDAGYVDMYAKYQKVPVNEREEFFKNNKVPKNKVKKDSTALFDIHNIRTAAIGDDFDHGQE
jgi:hypothetical protein